ncbi:MAG: DegQ family serine endoprotease [Hyphomicrobiales bacterium]|nr:DegQ family serine endoprotease [Hyphomicrobiales bacterium]
MRGTPARLARLVRPCVIAVGAIVLAALSTPALARGPEAIADVAAQVIEAVVNISTSQNVGGRGGQQQPLSPNDPQIDDLFRDFFNRRGKGEPKGERPPPRRVNSLGSGFIIDATGIVVTNNHVIAEADEITVILNDGTRVKGEVMGRDQKTDIALLRIKTDRPLKAVRFGDSDKLRLGEWVIAIGNPFSFGGSVTAGIVSALNRDINSGPYDNYIQTDAAINRGNSGGPLFNLNGEVVGVNTAIISPSGGSIGIGFAVPSKTALSVIGQLKEFGETRRGWLGVRIQMVTDEIAESLGIKPARGALVAGVDERGPAKPAGILPGDVIVRFDGKDIREMRDLPRVVADTPVGKDVAVVIIRKGKEQTLTVTLGRLEDSEKQAALTKPKDDPPSPPPVVTRALGIDLAGLSDDLRKKFKIRDTVKGIIILGVQPNSPAADKRLTPGDVIVEIAQEPVQSPDEFQSKVERLRKDGRPSALLLVASADGELRFVALSLQ